MVPAGDLAGGEADGQPEKKRKKKRARWEDPAPEDQIPDFPAGMELSSGQAVNPDGGLESLPTGPTALKPAGAGGAMDDTPVVGAMGDTPTDAYATPVAGAAGGLLDETPTGIPLKKTEIGSQVGTHSI